MAGKSKANIQRGYQFKVWLAHVALVSSAHQMYKVHKTAGTVWFTPTTRQHERDHLPTS